MITTTTSFAGKVHHIFYSKPETGYHVFSLINPDKVIKVVGIAPELKVGESVSVEGIVEVGAYGRQLKMTSFKRERPKTTEGIFDYLVSHLPNIGETRAKLIIEKFGEGTLDVIKNTPSQLLEISGLTQERVDEIVEAFHNREASQDVYMFLYSIGVKGALAGKIYEAYGRETIEKVTQNPYLLTSVHGVGFLSADKIALNMGYSETGEFRLHAAIIHVLKEAENQGGHCFLESPKVRASVSTLLKFNLQEVDELIVDVLKKADGNGIVIVSMEGVELVYRQATYIQELEVANRLKRLMDNAVSIKVEDSVVEKAGVEFGLTLSDEQKGAISRSLKSGVSIITGGPGTGKTTLVRALVACVERSGDKIVVLCAPTGRAAKRLSQATGKDASTIHRLLFNVWKGEEVIDGDKKTTLPANAMYIVDESSMIDLSLVYALLHNIPDGAQVVFIGDIDQLPSVGCGDVLRDMIASDKIATTRLNSVFRQHELSTITTNAYKINNGLIPVRSDNGGSIRDFYIFPLSYSSTNDYKMLLRHIEQLSKEIPHHDIQVLTPMRKGNYGVVALNKFLQHNLNPFGERIFEDDNLLLEECPLKIGDRVMHIKNNYNLNVFNGDVGVVSRFDSGEGRVIVKYDEREVVYTRDEVHELRLAYACTVHKSQGSEYPAVIMFLGKEHSLMRQRNLLYTAVTRAKRTCALFTDFDSVNYAVSNNTPSNRNSLLDKRIRNSVV